MLERKRRIIAHAHIFKNAGSTIDWILKRNFKNRFIDNREDAKMQKDAEYLLRFLSSNKKMAAFSSHSIKLPIEHYNNLELFTLVMLRHPLLRVRSVYDFERKQPEKTPGSLRAKKYSFSEYVTWRMKEDVAPTIRNFHIRYLTSNSLPQREGLTDVHFRSAVKFILSNQLVGIVEDFDESMVVFSSHLASNDMEMDFAYEKQNESSKVKLDNESKIKLLREDLGDDLYSLLLENNEMDLYLYYAAREIVLQRFRAIPDREEQLQQLRNKCI